MSAVVRLYRSGKNLREVAAIVGMSAGWVRLRLIAEGEPRRRSGGAPPNPELVSKISNTIRANNPRVELLEESLSLVASGCTFAEAAIRLGLTRSDVAGYVFRARKRAERVYKNRRRAGIE
jgi:DNA-binding CsgD family transcriptional regulator